MNSLEEIAASCWEDAERQVNIYESDHEEKVRHEFARRLVAALGAQEPVAWMLGDAVYRVKQCRLLTNPPGEYIPGQVPLFAAPVLPSVPEGWIDVKDRLPDTAGVFLVMCDRGIQSYHPIIGIFNRDFDSPYPWSVPGTASVMHWMPLPSPPKK